MNVPEWIEQLKDHWYRPADDWWAMRLEMNVPIIDSDQRVRVSYRIQMDDWAQGWRWSTKDAATVHPYWWYPRLHRHICDTLDKAGYVFDPTTGYALPKEQ